MPGTELTPERRADLVRNLTIAGWLLLGGPIGFVLFQLDRVRCIGSQPFASVWDQRIEVLSFLMLPPNQAVLVPVVFVAAAAIWLAGADRDALADDAAAAERGAGDHVRRDRRDLDREHPGP